MGLIKKHNAVTSEQEREAIQQQDLNQPAVQSGADQDRQARSLPELLLSLESDSAASRRWAARDLISYPSATETLVNRLKREADVSVREVILTTLTRMGDPAAISGLIECLRSDDVALRNEVIDTLKQLPEEVAPIMHDLLTDSDSDVRIFAVNILESLRHPNVEQWLIEVIEQDTHVNVCATALDLLSEVGSSSATEALNRLKTRFSDEPYILFAADLALKRILES